MLITVILIYSLLLICVTLSFIFLIVGNKLGKVGKPAYPENWLLTPPNLIPEEQTEFAVNFELDDEMATPGAFIIKYNHPTEFFLVSLTLLDVSNHGDIHFICSSWIIHHPKHRLTAFSSSAR